MKKTILLLGLITLFSCKKETTQNDTAADTAKTASAPVEMDSIVMQKAWMDYATPGDMHQLLASEVGKWNADMKFWMDPSGAPQQYTSTSEVSMIMDGRYQKCVYTGDMGGMPFEGIATVGYNNATGKFESTWLDNMGTGMMYSEGTYDAASKTISFQGEMMDPMSKQVKKFREEYVIVDDNTRKMSMFDTDPQGKEYQSMEITLTRQ